MKSIRETLERELKASESPFDALQWESPRAYGDWLAQTYYYVCHSTRLLGLMASHIPYEQNKFHLRCIEHMREERAHEVLALNDLKRVGRELAEFPERTNAALLYQSQYYLIQHRDPLSLLGYILYLEGIAVHHAPRAFARVKETHGVAAATFLKVHAEEDPDHLPKALQEIERTNPHQIELIENNLMRTSALYRGFLEDIAEENRLSSVIEPFGQAGQNVERPASAKHKEGALR